MTTMSSYDALRKRIAEALEEKGRLSSLGPSEEKRARALGLFLGECLQHIGLSREEFAGALAMEQELAEAILDGVLPVSELDDDLLQQISLVIGCNLELLRTILA
jgi:hypothetical protein